MQCQKYRHLFEPITIHNMTVKNRLVMPPMGTNFANPENGEWKFKKLYGNMEKASPWEKGWVEAPFSAEL